MSATGRNIGRIEWLRCCVGRRCLASRAGWWAKHQPARVIGPSVARAFRDNAHLTKALAPERPSEHQENAAGERRQQQQGEGARYHVSQAHGITAWAGARRHTGDDGRAPDDRR